MLIINLCLQAFRFKKNIHFIQQNPIKMSEMARVDHKSNLIPFYGFKKILFALTVSFSSTQVSSRIKKKFYILNIIFKALFYAHKSLMFAGLCAIDILPSFRLKHTHKLFYYVIKCEHTKKNERKRAGAEYNVIKLTRVRENLL